MESINGYQYITEQEAINARELCNAYYGIPFAPDDVTQNWVDYQFAELNEPQFWYITYDISLVPILGEPTEFEVIYPHSHNENRQANIRNNNSMDRRTN